MTFAAFVRATCAAAVSLLAARLVPAQGINELASIATDGTQADDDTFATRLSGDGNAVAFTTRAKNVVAGNTNGHFDVFVRDRAGATTTRVTVGLGGAEADDDSFADALSADGREVAFSSLATNLVAGDGNAVSDVFLHDRVSGAIERISVDSSGREGDGPSLGARLSADGRFVAFTSYADNLVAGDDNHAADVFLRDRATQTTTRISVDATSGGSAHGASVASAISTDGRFIVFASDADDLVAVDTNMVQDVFLHDRATGSTERVSVDSGGGEANGASYGGGLSAEGSVVVFTSVATNLVVGDSNGFEDVFVRDRASASTDRVSNPAAGGEANGPNEFATISQDGRWVAFSSFADNLVTGDTNLGWDTFEFDRTRQQLARISLGTTGEQSDGSTYDPAYSADATVLAFRSYGTNLVDHDANSAADAFVFARCTVDASWSNYGAGFPGTVGIPGFTARGDPVLGDHVTLDLTDSYGPWTVGLLFVGLQRASFPSVWGGDLLVVPSVTSVIAIPSSGAAFLGDLPFDGRLGGVLIDLQAIELDPGAAHGVSFSAGLELVPGV